MEKTKKMINLILKNWKKEFGKFLMIKVWDEVYKNLNVSMCTNNQIELSK